MEEVISPISLKILSNSTKVVTGHMKGLLRMFDIEKLSSEVVTCELRHDGNRIKVPISSIS